MADKNDLVVRDAFGNALPFCHNGVSLCARCNVELTADNDSGWSVPAPGGDCLIWQNVCIACDALDSNGGAKVADTRDLCPECGHPRTKDYASGNPNACYRDAMGGTTEQCAEAAAQCALRKQQRADGTEPPWATWMSAEKAN